MKVIQPLLVLGGDRRGKGTQDDPCRIVRQVSLPDGTLLWEYDPITKESLAVTETFDRLFACEPVGP